MAGLMGTESAPGLYRSHVTAVLHRYGQELPHPVHPQPHIAVPALRRSSHRVVQKVGEKRRHIRLLHEIQGQFPYLHIFFHAQAFHCSRLIIQNDIQQLFRSIVFLLETVQHPVDVPGILFCPPDVPPGTFPNISLNTFPGTFPAFSLNTFPAFPLAPLRACPPRVQRLHGLDMVADIVDQLPGGFVLLLLLLIILMLHPGLGPIEVPLVLQPVVLAHYVHQHTKVNVQTNQQRQIYSQQNQHFLRWKNLYQIQHAVYIENRIQRQQDRQRHLPQGDMPPGFVPHRHGHQQNHHEFRHPGDRYQQDILEPGRIQVQNPFRRQYLKRQHCRHIRKPHRHGQDEIVQAVNLRRPIDPPGHQREQQLKEQVHPGISQTGTRYAHQDISRNDSNLPPGHVRIP